MIERLRAVLRRYIYEDAEPESDSLDDEPDDSKGFSVTRKYR